MNKFINLINKKARFEYFILDTYKCGIQLKGTEIKSIRQAKVSFADSYCIFDGNELFVKNLHIAEYSHGNIFNHDPIRNRKLLLSRKELKKLKSKLNEKGLTLIPVRIFMSERGFAKMEIGLAKGKKIYDKRESIKERDFNRER